MRAIVAAFVLLALFSAVMATGHHEMCCHSCHKSFAHSHLRDSCQRGCRMYGMIVLAHDKSVKSHEYAGLCEKSCKKTFSKLLGGADGRKACKRGCAHQDKVFQKHKADHHTAKKAVLHGLHLLPIMHSVSPLHNHIFQQLRLMHQRMLMAMQHAKVAAVNRVSIRIHSMPPGPDGKPRYHVEIHRYPTQIRSFIKNRIAGHKHHGGHHSKHHEHHAGHKHGVQLVEEEREWHYKRRNFMHRIRHFFGDMPHSYKLALRFTLCGLLGLSLIGLMYLFCSTFRASRPNTRLSLAKAFQKKPSVQSGDIFYVEVDKKPLIEEDELEKARREEA